MRSQTIRFPEIKTTRSRTGKCPVCGKPSRRSQTFSMTVSPFNRHPDGSVRTHAEVAAAVNVEADQWQPMPEEFIHAKCEAER